MTKRKFKNVELVSISQLPWVNRGEIYKIYDILADVEYNVVGEHNNRRHADFVCATREDTEIKRKTANGNFNGNWAARPVILTIGNRHFAAATHNAAHAPDMPRFRNPADIGHDGHFCVWVLEATTGSTDRRWIDSMFSAIQQAYDMMKERNEEAVVSPTVMSPSPTPPFYPSVTNVIPPTPRPPYKPPPAPEMVAALPELTPEPEIPKWGIEPLSWGTEYGITSGERPLDPATRIEVITMLHNLSKRTGFRGNDVTRVEETAPDPQPTDPQAFMSTFKGVEFTEFEFDALAKMVWAEARGEDDLGQQLVVHVILNRLLGVNFPDNLLEVLFQPNQFAPVKDGSFNNATPCERIQENVMMALSNHRKVVDGNIAPNPAHGATFFRSTQGADGSWHEANLTRLFVHGGHVFYK